MVFFIYTIILFFVTPSWSLPLKIIEQNPYTQQKFFIEKNNSMNNQGIDQLHKNLLKTKKFSRKIFYDDISFTQKSVNIDGQTITRSTPIIDKKPVEGADGIYNSNRHQNQFHYTSFPMPSASFKLSAAECMEKAIAYHEKSLLINPYVEKTEGYYEALWLNHFDNLRPAYKIRLPTWSIHDLKDIYIDAENGELLKIDDVAQFISAPSRLFVYSPTSATDLEKDLKLVMLPNLIDIDEDGFLRGEYISVKNCCRYFTCPAEGECTEETKRCALRSHENVKQSRELLSLPTKTLGLDPLVSLPEAIFIDTVRCTYLPFARASFKNKDQNILGFFDTPIDEPGLLAEMDRFAEIQAYFSVMSFFKNIRALLNDNTWCLRGEAMSCNADGSPVVDAHGTPVNPYRVFVNQLIPDMKLHGTGPVGTDNILDQIIEGKGLSKEDPIELNTLARTSNAAFVPALSTLKKSAPRADEMLSDLIKPFDHNVFFQGDRDFAYDGDVVFHEFMHAITTSLISKINSLGLDEWGIHSEPGGLNESWADYFAAAFTEDPALGEYASIKGGYGEVALRNIKNDAACPQNVIGEIHNDGLIWSGALWELRSRIKDLLGDNGSFAFDRAVLSSLAEATTTEDFKVQSEKLLVNIRARPELGEDIELLAREIFKKRGIGNCFRVATLSNVDDQNRWVLSKKSMLFVPSKNQIGLKNYAPSASQLEIGIPAGAKSMTLSWRQFVGASGALLGTEVTPSATKNIDPLGVIFSVDVPIKWKFLSARSVPLSNGLEIEPAGKAYFENSSWHFTMALNFDKCEQKIMYASLLSNDFKYALENISVDFDIDDSLNFSECDFKGSLRTKDLPLGCSTTNSSDGFFLVMLLFAFFRRRFNSVSKNFTAQTLPLPRSLGEL